MRCRTKKNGLCSGQNRGCCKEDLWPQAHGPCYEEEAVRHDEGAVGSEEAVEGIV